MVIPEILTQIQLGYARYKTPRTRSITWLPRLFYTRKVQGRIKARGKVGRGILGAWLGDLNVKIELVFEEES